MQRLLLFFAALLFVSVGTVQAQPSKLMLGEWVYSAPLDPNLDAQAKEILSSMFADLWFSFSADGTYKSAMMGREESGTWKIDAAGTRLTITPAGGRAGDIVVKELTETVWLMQLDPGKGFKMVHGKRPKE